MKKFGPWIICAVIVVVLAGAYLYARTTPYYSIFLLTRALNQRDPETALKYIDIDSIAENLAKNLFVDGKGTGKGGRDLAAAVSMNMSSIKEGLTSYITSVIRSGDAFRETQRDAFGFVFFGIQEAGILTLWRLDIETRGNTATVKLKEKPGQSAQMVKTDKGYWKFVGVNLDKTGKD